MRYLPWECFVVGTAKDQHLWEQAIRCMTLPDPNSWLIGQLPAGATSYDCVYWGVHPWIGWAAFHAQLKLPWPDQTYRDYPARLPPMIRHRLLSFGLGEFSDLVMRTCLLKNTPRWQQALLALERQGFKTIGQVITPSPELTRRFGQEVSLWLDWGRLLPGALSKPWPWQEAPRWRQQEYRHYFLDEITCGEALSACLTEGLSHLATHPHEKIAKIQLTLFPQNHTHEWVLAYPAQLPKDTPLIMRLVRQKLFYHWQQQQKDSTSLWQAYEGYHWKIFLRPAHFTQQCLWETENPDLESFFQRESCQQWQYWQTLLPEQSPLTRGTEHPPPPSEHLRPWSIKTQQDLQERPLWILHKPRPLNTLPSWFQEQFQWQHKAPTEQIAGFHQEWQQRNYFKIPHLKGGFYWLFYSPKDNHWFLAGRY